VTFPASISAGGAQEYSPQWSVAELRGLTYFRPNPFRGVTETPAHRVRPRFDDGGALRRPFSGALSFCSIIPELRCTPLRALILAHPAGALSNDERP